MHDVLEACLPYEVKELLKYFIHNGVISLPELNTIIQSFSYMGPDKNNKPLFPQLTLPSNRLVCLFGVG